MQLFVSKILDVALDLKMPWRLQQALAKYQLELLRRFYDRTADEIRPFETGRDNPDFEIHLLLGHQHVGMCLWAVKSLLHCANKKYRIALHDDGSLTDEDAQKLQRHLIGVRVFRKPEADEIIAGRIRSFPHVYKYRFGQLGETPWGRMMGVFSLKLLDFNLLSDAKKILVLDTDVLFFKRPDELISWVERVDSNEILYCKECYQPIYNSNKRLCGFEKKRDEDVPDGFNSGLICLDRGVLDLAVFEAWLEQHWKRVDTAYTFEQSAYNYLVRRGLSHRMLPESYTFNYNAEACVATHFGYKPFFFKNLSRIRKALQHQCA